MCAGDLAAEELRLAIPGYRQRPGRAERDDVHRLGGLAQDPQHQFDAMLLERRGVAHRVRGRTHRAVGPHGTGNIPAEEGIELPDRDEPRIARTGRVLVGVARRSGHRLAKAGRHVENHGLQIDLGQGVRGDQVEVVAHILGRVVQVGDVDHGNAFRRGPGSCSQAGAGDPGRHGRQSQELASLKHGAAPFFFSMRRQRAKKPPEGVVWGIAAHPKYRRL